MIHSPSDPVCQPDVGPQMSTVIDLPPGTYDISRAPRQHYQTIDGLFYNGRVPVLVLTTAINHPLTAEEFIGRDQHMEMPSGPFLVRTGEKVHLLCPDALTDRGAPVFVSPKICRQD